MVKNSAYFVLLLTKERVAGNKSTVLLDAESLSRNVPTEDAVQIVLHNPKKIKVS